MQKMYGVLPIMIDYTKVIDIRSDINQFIMQVGYGNECEIPSINTLELDGTSFNKQIFLYKKWLKSRSNPSDRVAPFECKNSSGVFSLDKYRRVFNSRLKPGEEHELFIE